MNPAGDRAQPGGDQSKLLPFTPLGSNYQDADPDPNDSAMFHGQIASPQWTWNNAILLDFETEVPVRPSAAEAERRHLAMLEDREEGISADQVLDALAASLQ